MLRTAALAAALMLTPAVAQEGPEADRLVACVVGQSVIEINRGADMDAAYSAAWELCGPIADLVPVGDEGLSGVEDEAFNTVYDYANGYTLNGELGAEY